MNVKKVNKKNKVILAVEHTHGEEIEELLRRHFVDEDLSIREISRTLNLSYSSVLKYLELSGIYSRRLRIIDGTDNT